MVVVKWVSVKSRVPVKNFKPSQRELQRCYLIGADSQPEIVCFPLFRMSWLFESEDVLLPSVYLRWNLTSGERVGLVGGRVKEALRIARQMTTSRKKVLPYYWYKYQDRRDTDLSRVNKFSFSFFFCPFWKEKLVARGGRLKFLENEFVCPRRLTSRQLYEKSRTSAPTGSSFGEVPTI